MPSAQRTVVIHRPLAEVFAFFTDATNDPSWRPWVKDIEVAAGGPAAGTVVKIKVSGPLGPGIPADIEITDFEPPHLYAFRVTKGPVKPTGSYRFAASAEGTEVTFQLAVEIGGLKKMVLTGPVETTFEAEMAALDTAKALLESR